MPIYEYCCSKCGHKFEVLTTMDKRNEAVCEKCGATVSRVYNGKCNFGSNCVGTDGCGGNCATCSGCHH